MSHFTVLVIGPDVDGQLAKYNEQLEVDPYDKVEAEKPSDYWAYKGWVEEGKLDANCSMEELLDCMRKEWDDGSANEYFIADNKLMYTSTRNPDSKWDWYSIGGRWRGYFRVKAGVSLKEVTVGEPGVFDNAPGERGADQLRKDQVDFEYIRNATGLAAQNKWTAIRQAIAGLENTPFVTWDDMRRRHDNDGDAAREAYHAQPQVVALKKAELLDLWGDSHERALLWNCSDYIERARLHAVSTYAIVMDGKWYQKGQMGWWGMDTNEIDPDEWAERFNDMLDGLPGDTQLTLIDAHI